MVEDVVTTGGSTIKAIDRVREEGLEVCGVMAILDRLAGGADAIREAARGAPYTALTALWLVAHAWAVGPATLPPYIDAALRARRQAAGWVMLPQFVAFLWPWYPQSSDLAIWIPTRTLAWPVVAGAAITLAAGAGVSALAWRRYLASMDLYSEFAAWHTVGHLIDHEWIRLARVQTRVDNR